MDKPATLVWNDSLITGVPEIDAQHRILVHTLNEAGDGARAILVELGRRKMVGGQEDMIVDVALDMLKEQAN